MCDRGYMCVFFFKQKTAYEMRISDWSSDVCSSDLERPGPAVHARRPRGTAAELHGGAAVGPVAPGPGDARGVRRAARCAAAHAREAGRAGGAGGTARGTAGGHAGRTKSEEHTTELQSLMRSSSDALCLQKKRQNSLTGS